MNVVLDTNTVISGLFWKGAPRQVLDLARDDLITLYTSPELLRELADVLGREKFARRLTLGQAKLESLVYGYSALARVIRPDPVEPIVLLDPDDDNVLACAKASSADCIVSGDSHLLDLKKFEEIEILTAADFIRQFQQH